MGSSIKTLRDKAALRHAAWARLGILPEDVQKHPTITPILINSLGPIPKVIDYLRGSDTKEAKEVVRLWDEATKNMRQLVSFEGFCLAAHSTPKQMIGIIVQTIVEQSNVASELMLAVAHPEVVQKTIKLAKTKAGVDERKVVLQNRGVLPAPKNQVFNNYGQVTQDNRKQVANVSVGQLEDDSDKISLAVDKFNADRANKLPAKAEVIDVVDESDEN